MTGAYPAGYAAPSSGYYSPGTTKQTDEDKTGNDFEKEFQDPQSKKPYLIADPLGTGSGGTVPSYETPSGLSAFKPIQEVSTPTVTKRPVINNSGLRKLKE